jgi:predicted RNA binding protein YcfA (HicA-like mRNA interferase family)
LKLPRVNGKQAVDAYLKAGFIVQRVRGSHYMLKNPETGNRITIPFHRKTLAPKTLDVILKHAGITPEQFSNFL